MSEQSHDYQVSNDVPVEQVSSNEVSNAFEEQMIDQENAKTLNGNDIEAQPEPQQQEEPEQPQNDQFSSKFAALSRKEKDLRQREKQFEDKISQFEAKMAEFEAANAPKQEPEHIPADIRKNPLKALEEAGYSYEDLTNMILNEGKMSPEMQLKLMREEIESDYKSKYEELNNKLIEKEKAEEEKHYQQTLNNFKAEIQDVVNSSEEYDYIQANEAYDLVFDIIDEYYQENKEVLDINDAARQVEQYLEEESMKLVEKSKKLKSKFAQLKQSPNPASSQSPTLSNSNAATSKNPEPQRLLSREESIARLASQIKWED